MWQILEAHDAFLDSARRSLVLGCVHLRWVRLATRLGLLIVFRLDLGRSNLMLAWLRWYSLICELIIQRLMRCYLRFCTRGLSLRFDLSLLLLLDTLIRRLNDSLLLCLFDSWLRLTHRLLSIFWCVIVVLNVLQSTQIVLRNSRWWNYSPTVSLLTLIRSIHLKSMDVWRDNLWSTPLLFCSLIRKNLIRPGTARLILSRWLVCHDSVASHRSRNGQEFVWRILLISFLGRFLCLSRPQLALDRRMWVARALAHMLRRIQ